MADLPANAKDVINAHFVSLLIGADKYLQLQEITFHLGRPERREPTTDGGVKYFYGQSDHFFDFVILASTEEISTILAMNNLDANGDLPIQTIRVQYRDKNGTVKTVESSTPGTGFQAQLPDINIEKVVDGAIKFRGRFRIIDDSVTVA